MTEPITVRAARCEDAKAIAGVHVESWRTTYRGIVPEDYLANLSVEGRAKEWEPVLCTEPCRGFVYVAEEARRVVGFASAGRARGNDPRFQGELYAIYLLESHQRRGVGGRLVRRLVGDLVGAGVTSMMLWVLAANPARRFYEALGGIVVGTQRITIGGIDLEEVELGWDDLRPLLSL